MAIPMSTRLLAETEAYVVLDGLRNTVVDLYSPLVRGAADNKSVSYMQHVDTISMWKNLPIKIALELDNWQAVFRLSLQRLVCDTLLARFFMRFPQHNLKGDILFRLHDFINGLGEITIPVDITKLVFRMISVACSSLVGIREGWMLTTSDPTQAIRNFISTQDCIIQHIPYPIIQVHFKAVLHYSGENASCSTPTVYINGTVHLDGPTLRLKYFHPVVEIGSCFDLCPEIEDPFPLGSYEPYKEMTDYFVASNILPLSWNHSLRGFQCTIPRLAGYSQSALGQFQIPEHIQDATIELRATSMKTFPGNVQFERVMRCLVTIKITTGSTNVGPLTNHPLGKRNNWSEFYDGPACRILKAALCPHPEPNVMTKECFAGGNSKHSLPPMNMANNTEDLAPSVLSSTIVRQGKGIASCQGSRDTSGSCLEIKCLTPRGDHDGYYSDPAWLSSSSSSSGCSCSSSSTGSDLLDCVCHDSLAANQGTPTPKIPTVPSGKTEVAIDEPGQEEDLSSHLKSAVLEVIQSSPRRVDSGHDSYTGSLSTSQSTSHRPFRSPKIAPNSRLTRIRARNNLKTPSTPSPHFSLDLSEKASGSGSGCLPAEGNSKEGERGGPLEGLGKKLEETAEQLQQIIQNNYTEFLNQKEKESKLSGLAGSVGEESEMHGKQKAQEMNGFEKKEGHETINDAKLFESLFLNLHTPESSMYSALEGASNNWPSSSSSSSVALSEYRSLSPLSSSQQPLLTVARMVEEGRRKRRDRAKEERKRQHWW